MYFKLEIFKQKSEKMNQCKICILYYNIIQQNYKKLWNDISSLYKLNVSYTYSYYFADLMVQLFIKK